MKITIAEIPYLNCAPFYWKKKISFDGQAEWRPAHPRELGLLAKEGSIDAGPVSLLNIPDLEADFELLPFGISSRNEAGSVLLFSKVPADGLHEAQAGLTPQSATSTELLKLILREKFHIAPVFREGFSESDSARLFIGNQALFAALDPVTVKDFPCVMDLGREWKAWKGHSFVFARWMVRKNLPDFLKEALENALLENLRVYDENPASVLAAYEAACGWKVPEALIYLAGFEYSPAEPDYLGSLTTLSQFSSHLATSRS